MVWDKDAPQGNEAAKIMWDIVPYTNGTGLDLGCGPWKAFPHFIGVDNGHHFGTGGADVAVKTCESLPLFANGSMDFVFSSHLLEHIEDYQASLKEWWRVVKVGGFLCLYLPHKDFYPNVGHEGANPDHKHDFTPEDIVSAMEEIDGWDLVENQTRPDGNEYSFFQVYQKTESGHEFSCNMQKPDKTVAVCRYGAFGDALQTSSVVAGLKEQGYHVTVYTTDIGHTVLKHDPNIDAFCVQGKDQIPNQALGHFWAHLGKKYDKFVNLSETVEGTLLSIPGRINHTWPTPMRRKYMNTNYLEFMHDLAGVDHKQNQRFYATEDEKKWAANEKAKMGGRVVLWSLAGSAIHKAWPYLDAAIARILIKYRNAKVVLVGDHLCQLLEAGWEKEPRVFCRSGKWTIRQSLAFAQVADLVIGSETGVLNAVACEDVPKIVTMSHSSINNLTRDWTNCQSLTPKDTLCYPCHMMHYNFDDCHRDENTGVSICQANISVDDMWGAITKALGDK